MVPSELNQGNFNMNNIKPTEMSALAYMKET